MGDFKNQATERKEYPAGKKAPLLSRGYSYVEKKPKKSAKGHLRHPQGKHESQEKKKKLLFTQEPNKQQQLKGIKGLKGRFYFCWGDRGETLSVHCTMVV